MTKKREFTEEEVKLLVYIVAALDAEDYDSSATKSVIYKAKEMIEIADKETLTVRFGW